MLHIKASGRSRHLEGWPGWADLGTVLLLFIFFAFHFIFLSFHVIVFYPFLLFIPFLVYIFSVPFLNKNYTEI
jgi:hypothetical protein